MCVDILPDLQNWQQRVASGDPAVLLDSTTPKVFVRCRRPPLPERWVYLPAPANVTAPVTRGYVDLTGDEIADLGVTVTVTSVSGPPNAPDLPGIQFTLDALTEGPIDADVYVRVDAPGSNPIFISAGYTTESNYPDEIDVGLALLVAARNEDLVVERVTARLISRQTSADVVRTGFRHTEGTPTTMVGASLVETPYLETSFARDVVIPRAVDPTCEVSATCRGVPAAAIDADPSDVRVHFFAPPDESNLTYAGRPGLEGIDLSLRGIQLGTNPEFTFADIRIAGLPSQASAHIATPNDVPLVVEIGGGSPTADLEPALGMMAMHLALSPSDWRGLEQDMEVESVGMRSPDSGEYQSARLRVGGNRVRRLRAEVGQTRTEGPRIVDASLRLAPLSSTEMSTRTLRLLVIDDGPLDTDDPDRMGVVRRRTETWGRVGDVPDEFSLRIESDDGFMLTKDATTVRRVQVIHSVSEVARGADALVLRRRISALVAEVPDGHLGLRVSEAEGVLFDAPSPLELQLNAIDVAGIGGQADENPRQIVAHVNVPTGETTVTGNTSPPSAAAIQGIPSSTLANLRFEDDVPPLEGSLLRSEDGWWGRIVSTLLSDDVTAVVGTDADASNLSGEVAVAQSNSVSIETDSPDGAAGRVAVTTVPRYLVAVRPSPQAVLSDVPPPPDIPTIPNVPPLQLTARFTGLEALRLLLRDQWPTRVEATLASTRRNKSFRFEQWAQHDGEPFRAVEVRLARVPEDIDLVVGRPGQMRIDFYSSTAPEENPFEPAAFFAVQDVQDRDRRGADVTIEGGAGLGYLTGTILRLPSWTRITLLPAAILAPGAERPPHWEDDAVVDPWRPQGLKVEVSDRFTLHFLIRIGWDRDRITSSSPEWWSGTLARLIDLEPTVAAVAPNLPGFRLVSLTDRSLRNVTDPPAFLGVATASAKLTLDIDANDTKRDIPAGGWSGIGGLEAWNLVAEIQAKDYEGSFAIGQNSNGEEDSWEDPDGGKWYVRAVGRLGFGSAELGNTFGPDGTRTRIFE